MGKLRLPGSADEALGSLVAGLAAGRVARGVYCPPGAHSRAPRRPLAGRAAGRVLRVVNFHATPRYRAEEYRRQIAAYARLFEPITFQKFDSAFDGTWPHVRPGLMPVLFEGFRDNVDVMLPILEEHGFKGWFFVPSAFPAVTPDVQRSYAKAHRLHLPSREEYPGERVAMTWEEA